MKRREFIAGLGAAAWPLVARAQRSKLPVIGWLSSGSPNSAAPRLDAFRQGLRETSYIEHRSVGIEYRWAEGQYGRLPALAADLVNRQVAVIFATGGARPAHLRRGWYVAPTILAGVSNSMRVAREEIFGPVLCLIPYAGEDDAVRIANDSPYGLAGGVWTGDPATMTASLPAFSQGSLG